MIELRKLNGSTLWLDPDAIIGVEEIQKIQEPETDSCLVYFNVHAAKVIGTIDEVMGIVCGT